MYPLHIALNYQRKKSKSHGILQSGPFNHQHSALMVSIHAQQSQIITIVAAIHLMKENHCFLIQDS
jgi:hypothetical protein